MALVIALVGYPIGVLFAAAGPAGRARLSVSLATALLPAALSTLWAVQAATVPSPGGRLASPAKARRARRGGPRRGRRGLLGETESLRWLEGPRWCGGSPCEPGERGR